MKKATQLLLLAVVVSSFQEESIAQAITNNSPVVQITAPVPSGDWNTSAGADVLLAANAFDTDGTIFKVQFFAESVFLGEDTAAPYEIHWQNLEPGVYPIVAYATDDKNQIGISETINVKVQGCEGNGAITREVYYNIGGSRVAILTSNPRFGVQPSFINKRYSFEGDTNVADNYGSRLYGFICAPQTGMYTFYVSGDDRAELWLSTDESPDNKALIAYVESPVKKREYSRYPAQTSLSVHLVKGARYYVEALHKEGTKSDHVSVAWTLPDSTFEGPIPGKRLSPGYGVVSGLDNLFLNEHSATSINAFPVPTKDQLHLRFNAEKAGPATVSFVDAFSNEFINMDFDALKGSNQLELSFQGLRAGMYFVHVTVGQQHLVQKVTLVE